MSFSLIGAALGLADLVPAIAKWLGGPNAQSVARQVIDTAKNVTKLSSVEDALKSLNENPSLATDFQREIAIIDAQFELELMKDRQNSRERDIALSQMGRRNTRADIMVLAAAFGMASCLYCLTVYSKTMPGEAVGIISTIAGIFGACLKDAYTFEFGSSRSSYQKDVMLALKNNN